MSAGYSAVLWNRQKIRYDMIMAMAICLYLVCFIGASLFLRPNISAETMIIRCTGSLALIMLHIILMIGPLSRLNNRFIPLLYNRRHLGVTMFLIALIHGVFAIYQFHTLGDTHPIVSIFTANTQYDSLSRFPFQPLGFISLCVLFVMAATSHDFWLKNLSPFIWKSLHMLVYLIYFLLIGHVVLGILQYETFPLRYILLGIGILAVTGLHVLSFLKGRKAKVIKFNDAGFVPICDVNDINDDRAKIFRINKQEIAVFKYDGKISAIHNICKHQNGPLGEGKVIDGCVTCPWHGYQYLPGNGSSPPPFDEKVHTYRTKVEGQKVFVDPNPLPEGTAVEPSIISLK